MQNYILPLQQYPEVLDLLLWEEHDRNKGTSSGGFISTLQPEFLLLINPPHNWKFGFFFLFLSDEKGRKSFQCQQTEKIEKVL